MLDRIARGIGMSCLLACTNYVEAGRLDGVGGEGEAVDDSDYLELLADAETEWDGYDDERDPTATRCAKGVRLEDVVPVDPLEEIGSGQLRMEQSNGTVVALPLAEVSFDTVVLGTIADTEVRQVFENPFEHAIEAVYVFPLPHDAAVDDYAIEIGKRTIRGVMKRRDEARAAYEAARDEGRTAGLLEQERPNVFTQSVANIPPGERVTVVMHMVGPVAQDRGHFELALPTVVGPRYMPDGSKFGPRVLPKGYVGCAELSVHVEIDAGAEIHELDAKHHEIAVTDRRFVELAKDGELLNRDFVLGWSLATKAPTTSIMLGSDGYFQLSIMPPRLEHAKTPEPRELVFVLDTSGSMAGEPLALSKATMHGFLAHLGPADAFQVIDFSDRASQLGRTPLRNTRRNVAMALAHIRDMQGMGGTEMVSGIRAALRFPHTEGRARYVLMLTDGYIGNETEIFGEVERLLGPSRVFALGVGASPNRYLLDGLARAGRGAVVYTENHASPPEAVARFYRRLAHPVLTDLAIEWGDVSVEDVVPARIPDLFTGQPVVVYGRMLGTRSGEATLVGRAGGKRIEIPIRIDETKARRTDGLASMWARRKVEELEDSRIADPTRAEKVEVAVTDLALEHHVMTAYTAFVAIDDSRIVLPGGGAERFDVPVDAVQYMSADELTSSPVVRQRLSSGDITRDPEPIAQQRLDRLVERRHRELARCFDAGEKRVAVRVAVSIDADGKVADVEFSPLEATVEACLRKEIQTWKIRRPGSATLHLRVLLDGRGSR